jgi:hypothetical protein
MKPEQRGVAARGAGSETLSTLVRLCVEGEDPAPEIPRRLLESKLDRPSDFLALRIDRSNPLSMILVELLTRCLDIELSVDSGPRIAKRLSNAMLDLVASICDLERDAIPAAQVSLPLERVMRFARQPGRP